MGTLFGHIQHRARWAIGLEAAASASACPCAPLLTWTLKPPHVAIARAGMAMGLVFESPTLCEPCLAVRRSLNKRRD